MSHNMMLLIKSILLLQLIVNIHSQSGLNHEIGCGLKPTNKFWESSIETKIVRGYKANPFDWPWIVALFRKTPFYSHHQFCGGSIISENCILTAAHCIDLSVGLKVSELYVGVGSNNLDSTIKYPISKIILHPKYVPNRIYNDIALICTSTPINFNDTIRPICLPESSLINLNNVSDESDIEVAGWGKQSAGGISSSKLLAAKLSIIPHPQCNASYVTLENKVIPEGIRSDQFCAGGQSDSCQGDSGGPLTMKFTSDNERDKKFYQIGIVSFGRGCGNPNFPGVYTKVDEYVPWIKRTMKRQTKCGIKKRKKDQTSDDQLEADAFDWPWMASLLRKRSEGYEHICGASIISENCILTGAICLHPTTETNVSELFVGIGSSDSTKTIKVAIRRVIIHPKHTDKHHYHDIALLFTSSPIKFDDRVTPVCLPETATDQNDVKAAGWREVDGASENGRKLQISRAEVVTNQECNRTYANHKSSIIPEGIRKDQVCAKTYAANQSKTSCYGYGGGPLTAQKNEHGQDVHYQIGINSFGKGCDERVYPGVYTRVAEYLPWIESKLDRQSNCGIRQQSSDSSAINWPWMATLLEKTSDGYNHFCGGSIISQNCILTGAQCVTSDSSINLSQLYVGIGSNNSDETIKLPIHRIIIHPENVNLIQYHDIAVICTSTPFTFNDRVMPICLPDFPSSKLPKKGQNAVWRRDGEREKIHLANYEIVPNQLCNQTYYPIIKNRAPKGIINDQLCARTETVDAANSCAGYGGGPLSVQLNEFGVDVHYQVGIISFGRGCKDQEYPGVFTRVTEYIPWIEQQLKANELL